MQPLGPLPSREQRLERLREHRHQVVVVGGGITGEGLALDLALRGVEVALLERGDWAAGASSASSCLIHGGLRYLEGLELGLVRDSCRERARLLDNAAGLVWPERFVFPVHRDAQVGRLKLAAGLGLYTLTSLPHPLGMPGMLGERATRAAVPGIRQEGLRGAGTYLDGATDDARLTLAVVTSAIEAGALALSRLEVDEIEAAGSGVELSARDVLSGEPQHLRTHTLVLAGGALTDSLRAIAGLEGGWVQPTRGSHILVPRERLAADGAVIFPSAMDGRIVFLIPWPGGTIIGTTDLDAEPSHEVLASHGEARYLLDAANALVPAAQLDEQDVVSSWAGLRPLLRAQSRSSLVTSAPSARSREERIQREGRIYTIAGGKLTAYRSMVERLATRITREQGFGEAGRRSATRNHPLRGALPRRSGRPSWSQLDEAGRPRACEDLLAETWSRRYAGLADAVRELCSGVEGGNRPLAAGTLLGEVDWAVRHEDCLRAEDFLMRRTDLGRVRPDEARACLPALLERLAGIQGWDGERQRVEGEAAERALERGAAWRTHGPRKSA